MDAMRIGFPHCMALLITGGLAACTSPGEMNINGTGDPGEPGPDILEPDIVAPTCAPDLSVSSDGPALLVTDPAVLSHFSLERVLQQIIDNSSEPGKTPEELLKRLFDTQNTTAGAVFPDLPHCDSPDNSAFKNGPAVDCPRAEGALAKSPGLFDPTHPDYFAPMALVNRMDLMSQGMKTCGEFRLVFAKISGRTDPNDRVFLIFEGSLENPSFKLEGCMPVARLWSSLEEETEPEQIAAKLEAFYFTGLEGFKPLVHPDNLGVIGGDDDPYGATHGQIRVSQHMQEPWELREFRATGAGGGAPFYFRPVTVKNNPLPELFDKSVTTPIALQFQSVFLVSDIYMLGSTHDLAKLRMPTSNHFNAGQSALGGLAATDYLSHAQVATDVPALLEDIDARLALTSLGVACPPDDPLDAKAIIARASVQTCAGCHAPAQFIGAERRLGCGVTFPESLGQVHIDENGLISPALEEVFLPRRAEVMTKYIQFCDIDAIHDNLEPGGFAETK